MNSSKFLTIVLLGLASTSTAYATSFSYDHKYEDVSKAHTDELKFGYDFESGIGVAAKLKFSPNDEKSGDAGVAFHDERWQETELGLSYSYDVNEKLSVEPGVTWSRKQDEYKYKPYLSMDYALTPNVDLSSRYRYEISDYSFKETKRVNRFDAGISRKFGAFEVGYTLTLYRANVELYNERETDYEHAIEFKYKATKALTPFIELSNESVSKHTDQRQTEFEVGVKYKI